MTRSNTITRSYGGKGGMLKKILPFIPPDIRLFGEFYGGAGAVMFGKDFIAPVEIFNDLDHNIYALFSVLQDRELFKEFSYRIGLLPYSRYISDIHQMVLGLTDLSLLDRAMAFFYVNRTRRGGGSGGFQVATVTRRGTSKSVSDYLSAVDRLDDFHARIQNMIIENKDALLLIRQFDDPVHGNVFYYLDPPYHWETRTGARYKVDMSPEQHADLVTTLLGLRYAKVLVSGYDHKEYDRLKGWNKAQFSVNTNSGSNVPKTKIETLWFNYEIGVVT